MDVNSEAIYGTKRSPWSAAPPWGRITVKGHRLYLIVFDWPEAGAPLRLALNADKIDKATLLAGGASVATRPTAEGVEFTLPPEALTGPASVVAVDTTGDIEPT